MPTLDEIRIEVESCTKCALCEGRTNVVFGSGNSDARVLLIGEAPGKNEDIKGEPFIGAAGKVLDEMLEAASLSRDDVFIANVLKCRPPSNRNPRVEEIEQCANFLRAQTAAINPEIIVTMGNFATQFILRSDKGITELRGKDVNLGNYKVFPVFHPASTMYDRKKKEVLLQDFKFLKTLLDV